jgi:hypothetical protein
MFWGSTGSGLGAWRVEQTLEEGGVGLHNCQDSPKAAPRIWAPILGPCDKIPAAL